MSDYEPKVKWIPANSEEGILTVTGDAATEPPLKEMQEYVDGYIEHVNVLYEGRRQHMFVNEMGAISTNERGPLPVNERATEIYQNASVTLRGASPANLPKIHGNAILLIDVPME